MPTRRSVDLSAFPNLVVVYLGYRATALRGVSSLYRIGRGLSAIQAAPPDGLLAHETMLYGWRHVGFRQYWRDLESLEAFTRDARHAEWWRSFSRDSGGGGFWHESYSMRGGMEGIYLDTPPKGLGAFAPERAPVGAFKHARQRLAA